MIETFFIQKEKKNPFRSEVFRAKYFLLWVYNFKETTRLIFSVNLSLHC